jgi:hypothetical protein
VSQIIFLIIKLVLYLKKLNMPGALCQLTWSNVAHRLDRGWSANLVVKPPSGLVNSLGEGAGRNVPELK